MTCRKLATLGAKAISIADIQEDLFENAEKELKTINANIDVLTSKVDATSSSEIAKWIDNTIEKFGTLDGAVNCVGTINFAASQEAPLFLNETDESWNRVMNLNLSSVFYSMRAEVKAMIKLPKAPRSIVNLASAASLVHDPTILTYSVSKAAVASLSTTVSKDVAQFDIRVNAVSPSATKTGMALKWYKNEEEAVADMKKRGITLLEPETVANTVVWLLGEESTNISGANIPVGASPP